MSWSPADDLLRTVVAATDPDPAATLAARGRARLREHDDVTFDGAGEDLGDGVVADAERHIGVDLLAILHHREVAPAARGLHRAVRHDERVRAVRDDDLRRAAHPGTHRAARQVDGDLAPVDPPALRD